MTTRPSSSLRSRDSVYHGAVVPKDHGFLCSPHIQDCVNALEDSLLQLHNIGTIAHDALSDVSRLAGVLQSERMSVMVNEPTIDLYRSQMAEEIEPQILEMVQRAESGIVALERKARTMKAKVEATQSRTKALQPIPTATGTVSSKLEARRIATVAKQIAQAEQDMQSLTTEIQQLEELQIVTQRQ